jgi:hypothetical protein
LFLQLSRQGKDGVERAEEYALSGAGQGAASEECLVCGCEEFPVKYGFQWLDVIPKQVDQVVCMSVLWKHATHVIAWLGVKA